MFNQRKLYQPTNSNPLTLQYHPPKVVLSQSAKYAACLKIRPCPKRQSRQGQFHGDLTPNFSAPAAQRFNSRLSTHASW